MDTTAFDGLTRALAGGMSRRGVTRMLGGLTLGILTLGPIATDAKRGGKGKGKGKGKKKVTICHQGTTISVSRSAVKGHLKHGDTRGACGAPGSPANQCADGTTNGSETDVDCGGSCPRCATGKTCAVRSDCVSARCEAGTCQTCVNNVTDCGTDTDGSQCACRDHESGQRFCTKSDVRLLPVGTPCTECQGGEQCFPINGGANGIECILPCGA
jgi:hypothetical protein